MSIFLKGRNNIAVHAQCTTLISSPLHRARTYAICSETHTYIYTRILLQTYRFTVYRAEGHCELQLSSASKRNPVQNCSVNSDSQAITLIQQNKKTQLHLLKHMSVSNDNTTTAVPWLRPSVCGLSPHTSGFNSRTLVVVDLPTGLVCSENFRFPLLL